MKIALLQGEEALAEIGDAAFQRAWHALYQECPWATGYQDPIYACGWYRLYHGQWRPVLALAHDAQGALAGLLPLALDARGENLVGAGAAAAAYQTWLAQPAHSDAFILAALESLRQAFPRACLRLKHVPVGTPLDALRAAADRFGCLFSAPESRSWIRTDSERAQESLNGRTRRNLYNRLKRIGEVRFEVATDAARMEELLDEHIQQCDLRQAAMYDCPPFRDDAHKRKFYLELMREGRLHVSALHAGPALVSTNIGIVGKDSVQLGIAHSPQYAECSPGKLHCYLLCVELGKAGIPVFDLTPGGGYKSTMATDTDEVLELVALNAQQGRRLQRRARLMKATAGWLNRRGISTAEARLAVNRARKFGKLAWLGLSGALPWSQALPRAARHCVYLASDATLADAQAMPVAVDRLGDLLLYDAARGVKTYQEFQFDAMKRLEGGQHAYTSVVDGRLLFCAWVARLADIDCMKREGEMPAERQNLIALHDLHLHPSPFGAGMLPGFLSHVLADLKKRSDAGEVRLVLHAGDRRLRGEAEKAGFRLVEGG